MFAVVPDTPAMPKRFSANVLISSILLSLLAGKACYIQARLLLFSIIMKTHRDISAPALLFSMSRRDFDLVTSHTPPNTSSTASP